MKKIISFSLYKAPEDWEHVMQTNFDKYINGLNENIKLRDQFYPDWEIWIFTNVGPSLKNKFDGISNIVFHNMDNLLISGMQWRFLPHDFPDVERFIVRDLDSRFSERERVSVMEWIESGKKIHIMRDHPHHHYEILGGMWGMVRQENFNMGDECINFNKKNNYITSKDWYEKWWDMNFLREVIYKKYSDSSYINASYHNTEDWSTDFTTDRSDNNFVGEIFDSQNKRLNHYQLL